MKIEALIAALSNLSQNDLASVRAAADQLLIRQPNDLTVNDRTSPLYNALAALLGIHHNYAAFRKAAPYKQWKHSAPAVIDFIDRTFPSAKSKLVRHGLMVFLLEGLMSHIREQRKDVTIHSMVDHLPELATTFDDNFPGYRQNGLAGVVVDHLTRGMNRQ